MLYYVYCKNTRNLSGNTFVFKGSHPSWKITSSNKKGVAVNLFEAKTIINRFRQLDGDKDLYKYWVEPIKA